MIHGRLYNGSSHAAGELRYLPGVKEANESSDEAKQMLVAQIQSVCAVMNPSIIGYHSDFPIQICSEDIPYPKEFMPDLIHMNDVFKTIEEGLFQIGLKKTLKERGQDNV